LEFNVPFQHKYGYIRDEGVKLVTNIGSAECVALALYVGAMTE